MSEFQMQRGTIAPALGAGEFDDSWFEQGRLGWRGRIIALVLALAVLVAAALATWYFVVRGEAEAVATEQIVEARLGTVSDTIETSGSVSAQSQTSLNFEGTGEVQSVAVKLGQSVKKGDVLATLDAPALEDAVRRAQINLLSAQLKLYDLQDGADSTELASADESYVRALASYESAQRALAELREGASTSDLNAAQQKVLDAEASLAKARQTREELDTTNADAISAAESALAKADTTLAQAEQAQADAEDALSVSAAQLEGAEAAYCPDGGVSFCGSRSVPLSGSDEATLRSVTASGDPARASLASAVLDANTAYKQGVTTRNNADDAVDDASVAVSDAEDTLNDAQAGPSANDITAADKNVTSADLALTQAQDDLADLRDGADADDLRAAERELESADAALYSAEAQRGEAYGGAEADEISDQQGQVELAALSLAEAERDLEDAQIIAPFDGTVADVNIESGQTMTAGGTADTAAVILNTPNALVVDLAINESDLSSVKVGQTGTIAFDQLDGASYRVTIEAIGTNPTTTQGVTTYEAQASIDLTSPVVSVGPPDGFTLPEGVELPEGFTPPEGFELPEGFTPPEGAELPDGFTPGGAVANIEQARPSPGMSGTVTITIEEESNVVVVQSAAIQRDGLQQFVEVEKEDGTRERMAVETGLTDGSETAIRSGLSAGDRVVVTSTASGAANAPGGFQQGDAIIIGGDGPGSGGFFAGPAIGGGE